MSTAWWVESLQDKTNGWCCIHDCTTFLFFIWPLQLFLCLFSRKSCLSNWTRHDDYSVDCGFRRYSTPVSHCIKQNTPLQFRSLGMILLRVSWFVLLSVFDYSLLVLACIRLKELTGCFVCVFIGVGVFRVSFLKTCKNLQAWLARIWLISLFVLMLWVYKFFFTLMIFWNCTRHDNFSGQYGFRKTRTPAQIYLQKKQASSIRH